MGNFFFYNDNMLYILYEIGLMIDTVIYFDLKYYHYKSTITINNDQSIIFVSVFKYTPGLHNVAELGSESEYKSCDTSNAANSMSTGNDVVKLDKAGSRYFACGTAGHCSAGMKLKVDVVAGDKQSSGSSSSSTSSPSSSSSTSDVSSTYQSLLCSLAYIVLLALGVAILPFFA